MFDFDCRKSDVVEVVQKLIKEENANCAKYCALNPADANKRICDSAIYKLALTKVLHEL